MSTQDKQQRLRFLNKRRTWLFKAAGLLLGVMLVGLSLISFIAPDRTFSDQENRMLAEFPVVTMENIRSERFMKDAEDYVADQFIARDAWISLKTRADLLFGKKEFNQIVLAKGKYLMELPAAPDTANVERNMEAVNVFGSRHSDLNIDMMVVPNAVCVLEDRLPSGIPVRDQREDSQWLKSQLKSSVHYLDMITPLMEHKDEALYYKTDHHWTTKGAMYAFLAAADELEIKDPCESYDVYTVTETFEGTLASRAGLHNTKDEIQVYAPSGKETLFYVTDSDREEKRATLYDKSALLEKDKYQVFLGGNHAQVHIATPNENDRVLLLFKDSYANCFVPFLIPYYKEIFMVDPRYYYDDVEKLIENYSVTDVLFLYNMDTFLSDNSLADVLVSDLSKEG